MVIQPASAGESTALSRIAAAELKSAGRALAIAALMW